MYGLTNLFVFAVVVADVAVVVVVVVVVVVEGLFRLCGEEGNAITAQVHALVGLSIDSHSLR